MAKINTDKVHTLLGEAKKALTQMQEYSTMEPAGILSSEERLGKVKYQFIVCAEACLNLCQHISSKEFSAVPETYSECFEVLAAKNVLEPAHARRLAEFAGFRNVLLVHLYRKVDNTRVIEMLKNLSAVDACLNIVRKRYAIV